MSARTMITRRDFIISTTLVGGGMALSVSLTKTTEAAAGPMRPPATVVEFTPWISIAPDDVVTVRVPTPEIGNGTVTQFAMTVCEELDCDWSKVRTEYASVHRDLSEQRVYSAPGGDLGYFSGRSTLSARTQVLLQAGASARERLKAAAAARWQVPATKITTANGVLMHVPSGRTLRYGEVSAAAAQVELPQEPTPKPQGAWRRLGKTSPGKLHNPAIVNGSATYGIDVRLPDMVYAALMQSPVHGGKLKRYDFAAIKHMPGVREVVVIDPGEPRQPVPANALGFNDAVCAPRSGIAVIADHYWQARQALAAMPVEWDGGPGVRWSSIDQVYEAALKTLEQPGEQMLLNSGNVDAVFAKAQMVEATYLTPFCDHVTMEPLNGTALVTRDRVDLWHPTQHTWHAHLVAASETGLAPQNVHVHQTLVGGGFGRRVMGDDVRMVVAIAKKLNGRPVQVIWTREESMRQGRYRALQASRLRAVLDEQGYPRALAVRSAGRGMNPLGLIDNPYFHTGVSNARIESTELALHVLIGPFRGPSYNTNVFMVESFIDELAAAAQIDPLQYRLKLLERNPVAGWKSTLLEVAQKSRWGRKLPIGQAQGLAVGSWCSDGNPANGTTVATVATVEVSKAGEVKVLEIDCAFDCGKVLNADAVRQQMEGGSVFGMNVTMMEELTLEEGAIAEGNFDRYPMLRMSDVPPRVNVHFGGLTQREHFGEIGEAPAGPIGPAIANAIYRITGKRIRTTPLRKHDLSWGKTDPESTPGKLLAR